MSRTHLSMISIIGTMFSALLLLYTFAQCIFSSLKRQDLIVEHKRKVSMSITNNSSTQDYFNYMRLWIFHNIDVASRVSVISDNISKDVRTVVFAISNEPASMPEPPFGRIEHYEPSKIKWTTPAFNTKIDYPPIETSLVFTLQYIAVKQNGFCLLLNNDLIEYSSAGERVSQADGFYIIPDGGLSVHKNASIYSVSMEGLVLQLHTPDGEQFHKILCNQSLEMSYLDLTKEIDEEISESSPAI